MPPSLAFQRAPPLPDFAALVPRIIRCKFGGCDVREQETIIHNTGDEPILVEQADGSQFIVRPGEKRQARLLSRGDFANPATPIYPDARRDPHPRCVDCGEVMQMLRTVQENAGRTRWFWSTDARTGTRTRCSGGESQRLPERQ